MQAELLALADRVEALEGPTAEIFWEAFDAITPPPSSRHGDAVWSNIWGRFDCMIDAEAWTSAAEMLVPKGAIWSAETWDDSGIYPPHVLATAWVYGAKRVYAATPALALLAASLRALAGRV